MGRRKYDFDPIKPGASTHAKTSVQRDRITTAFSMWKRKNPARDLFVMSQPVDDTDPNGPGYRVFFLRDAERYK